MPGASFPDQELANQPTRRLSTDETSLVSGYWVTFILACCVLCLPFVLLRYPPLVDYPSHLARAYILAHYRTVSAYQRDYICTYELIPNLAVDGVFWVLLQFTTLATASRIFMAGTILLFATACYQLSKAIYGHPRKIAILCAFLIYDSMLFYGFVNYLFGVGMFCLTFACWWRWRTRWTVGRLTALALLILATYLSHLSAYAFVGIAFAVVGIFDYWTTTSFARLLPAFLLMIPEVVLFFVYHHHSATTGVSWGTLPQKMVGLGVLVLTYNYRFDAVWIVILLALAVYTLAKSKGVQVVWPVMTVGIVFLALYVASPHAWLGGSPVDARFIPPAAVLILSSLHLRISSRLARILFLVCLVLFSARMFTIWRTWRVLDKRIASQVEMFEMLPENATLYPVVMPAGLYSVTKIDRSFEHVAELASIVRHAFVPSRLAYPGQEILLYRTPRRYMAPDPQSPAWLEALRHYSFAWSYGVPDNVERALEANCDRIAEKDGGSLWRVRQ